MVDLLTTISSFATLILFVIYFIGRIWTVFNEITFGTEVFRHCSSEGLEEHEMEIDFSGMVTIETVSTMNYRFFMVSEVDIDPNDDKSVKRGESKRIGPVKANTPIYAKIDCPDIFPRYLVEFQRSDGIKGSFYFSLSGKTGEVVATDYKLKHTFSSVLYYLFR